MSTALLAIHAADAIGKAVSGPNWFADAFDDLASVDAAGSANLDTAAQGVLKPLLGGVYTFGPVTMPHSSNGWAGYNIRVRIDAPAIERSGSRVRLRLKGPPVGSTSILSIAIQRRGYSGAPWAVGATPIPLLFGGIPSTVIPAGVEVWTDWLSFSVNEAFGYTVCMYFGPSSSVAQNRSLNPAHYTHWDKMGANESLEAGVTTGYTENPGFISVVTGMQVDGVPLPMTVHSLPVPVPIIPDNLSVAMQVRDIDPALPNDDYKAYLSRNNGQSYTEATLEHVSTSNGTKLVTATANMSAQPVGNQLRWKFCTFNDKSVELHGAALEWAGQDRPPVAGNWRQLTNSASWMGRDGAGLLELNGALYLLGGWAYHWPGPSYDNNEVWRSLDRGRTWTRLPDAPWEKRHTAGWVVHDGYIWVIGGDANNGHYQTDMWKFDGMTWTMVMANAAPMSHGRVLFNTYSHAGKIWVVGGQTLDDFPPPLGPANPPSTKPGTPFYDDVWSFDEMTGWVLVSTGNPWAPRGMMIGNAVKDGYMWIIGGGTYDTEGYARTFKNDVWRSADGEGWEQMTANAGFRVRQYHNVVAFNGGFVMLGGWNNENLADAQQSMNGVDWFDIPNTIGWPARHAASLVAIDDRLIMLGGPLSERAVWELQ